MEGGNLTALERQCEITDDIIRKLVLRVDPRIADALVQHALAGDTAARRPAAPVGGPVAAVAVETMAAEGGDAE